MDEDHSEEGGHPGGQGNDDAEFIEAGEIAAEYEVRRFSSAELYTALLLLLLLVSMLIYSTGIILEQLAGGGCAHEAQRSRLGYR